VRQPMRQVMALRVSKAVIVFAIALFYRILVSNNIMDYGSEFVRRVLMMDSTFPGNHVMWRAVSSPPVHTAFRIGIIAWESVTMLLCWWGGVRLLSRIVRTERNSPLVSLRAVTDVVQHLAPTPHLRSLEYRSARRDERGRAG
jgi:predicted small integral membrane protein